MTSSVKRVSCPLTGKAVILAAALVAIPFAANADGYQVIVSGYPAANDAPWRFRHYRFKIDDCMGERIGVQLSEFRLLNGDKDGQMYILWGAEMSPNFDHYELWRDGKFLANVTNEVHNGLPYRVARYEDLGLPTHSRHEYCIRKVWKGGRKGPLGEPFYGLTRSCP